MTSRVVNREMPAMLRGEAVTLLRDILAAFNISEVPSPGVCFLEPVDGAVPADSVLTSVEIRGRSAMLNRDNPGLVFLNTSRYPSTLTMDLAHESGHALQIVGRYQDDGTEAFAHQLGLDAEAALTRGPGNRYPGLDRLFDEDHPRDGIYRAIRDRRWDYPIRAGWEAWAPAKAQRRAAAAPATPTGLQGREPAPLAASRHHTGAHRPGPLPGPVLAGIRPSRERVERFLASAKAAGARSLEEALIWRR